MHIMTVEEVIAEIKREYDRNSEGWRMLRGRDRRGHTDTYLMCDRFFWQLKTELRNPLEPRGVGAMVMRNPGDEIEELMDRGGPLPFSELYRLKEQSIITLGIGRQSRESARDIKAIISEKNEELEGKLNRSLERLLHREGICTDYI